MEIIMKMNLFLKSALFSVIGASIYADAGNNMTSSKAPASSANFYPGKPLTDSSMQGYNAPAGVVLKKGADSCCPDQNFFAEAAFLYYYIQEDGLDLASSSALANNTTPTTVALSNGKILLQDFKYNPCFDVGFGMNTDEWTLGARYTWIRSNTHTNSNAPQAEPAEGTNVWIPNNWFMQVSTVNTQSISGTNIDSKWHLGMDLADLYAGRAFYQGKRLMVTPYAGIRGAWIRQKLSMHLNVPGAVINGANTSISSNNWSNSWALGARMGARPKLMLTDNFFIDVDAAFSMLFTQYTTIKHSETQASSSVVPAIVRSSLHNYNTVRPEFDLGINLGWSSYLKNNRYHIDFSIGYQFMTFFEQNMIRKLMDASVAGTGAEAGALTLNGLNVSLAFNF
jgi:hypothetical protein